MGADVTAEPSSRRVVQYDFTRPDKFSKDQIVTMSIMHETFARLTTATLSGCLRCLAHARVASVDQLTYEEFIRSIPNPCTMAIVAMEPLKGSALLELDPQLTSAIIDRLFGGRGKAVEPYRELTEIESSAMEAVVARMLGALREAWAAVTDLRPKLSGLECNPMFAQIVPPSEMIVLVTLEARIEGAEGMINFAVPYLTIEPIMPRLSRHYIWSKLRPRTGRFPAAASLPMTAEIGYDGERLSLGALSALKKGALIAIPRYDEGTSFLQAGGARFVELKARRARRGRAAAFSLATPHIGTDLDILADVGREAREKKVDVPHEALRQFSAEVGAGMKSIEGRITDLARRQEELADQLIFASPEKEIPPGGRRAGQKRAPFSAYTRADCDILATFIGQEHPQLVALVLSYLEPGLAACVLAKIPEELRADVMERICSMDRTSPEVLREVERVLEKKLSLLSSEDYTPAGGVPAAVEILNMASRSLEKGIVDSLAKRDPRLADQVRKGMFVFEDVTLLDRETAARVLQAVEDEDLVMALKAASEEVRAFIWECVPRGEVEGLKARMERLGRARLRDVEEAQQRIVAVIRRMDEEGEIVLARPGETVG